MTDPWRVAKRRAGELAYEALDLASGTRRRAARLAANTRPLDVLVLGVYRLGSLMPARPAGAALDTSPRRRSRSARSETGPMTASPA